MCKIDEQKKIELWEKARAIEGYDSTKYRQDACGAWIVYDEYKNRDSDYGWEIDHIFPLSKLNGINVPEDLIDNISNLRPLNWKNNVSKGCDYPSYRAVCIADGNKNIDVEKEFIVNHEIQDIIKGLFKDYNIVW